MKRFIFILVALVSVSGCSSVLEPHPFGLNTGLEDGAPEGSPTFRYGWKNGCESGMAAYGSLHYKVMYGYNYDATALHDDEYESGWELGFRHCRWYTSGWVG